MGMMNKPILTPTAQALEQSIRNNVFFYYVSIFTWAGFMLYAIAYKDAWLLIDAVVLLICTIYFGLAQKIDKMRLELQRK